MARIRTIKPEFPQSETVGRLSRDARLLFVQLWTIVDDDGRARGSSRMLASLLYPYDDDAPNLIDGWMDELERGGCVRRYEADGSQYIDLPNWLKHQRIDRPTASKLPEFVEGSRALAPDLGPRTSTKDHGKSSLRSDSVHARDQSLDDEFNDHFWSAYPHKVGRLDALVAFRKARTGGAVKGKPSRKPADLADILAGLDRYIATKPDSQQWLNPATFLNQERYHDQPASTANGSSGPRRESGHDAAFRALGKIAEARDQRGQRPADPDEGLFDP